VRPNLSVTNGTHRRALTAQAGPLSQLLNLLDEAIFKHPLQSGADALMK
jgi:hypothetical protein